VRRLALASLVACGGAGKPVAPLVLQPSAPVALDGVGTSTPVIEQGDAVYVLAPHVATILRGGVVAARIETASTWLTAASIAAPDGDGRWVVAVDDAGALWRLTASGERQNVTDRFGLAGAKVRALGGAGTTTAFDLGDSVAYSTDGVHLARVPAAESYRFAVARGVLARAVKGGGGHGPYVEKWDLVHATRVTYPFVPNQLAFLDAQTDQPRLVAATDDRVWIEKSGELHALAAPAVVHEIAAERDALWIEASGKLFAVDRNRFVPTRLADHRVDLLGASQTGDAWLATERGLVRYSRGGPHDDPTWTAQVAPVFQRVCAHCHLPGGEAGIDLSTAASWQAERAELARRVLVTRTMPPAGTDLSDADRAAVAGWLNASR